MHALLPLAALVLSAGLFVPVAFAASPPPAAAAATPEATAVVAALKSTYKSTSSVRAEFTQVVRNTAMGTEDRQKGRISFEQPKKIRVEMGAPTTAVFISDGHTFWSYSVKDKQAFEAPELGGGSVGLSLEDLSRIDELFDVAVLPEKPGAVTHTLRLSPKQAGAFKALELTVTKQKYVLQSLLLVDQMDNETSLSFTAVRLGEDIPDKEFAFVAPPGVQVIKAN